MLLIEEFIQRGFPHVIGGDIFVWDGTIVLYGEMSCLRDTEKSPLIPIGEQMPSGLNAKQQANVHSELQRIVSALDIRFGELNIEIILDKDDNVHFLELGPRAGGNTLNCDEALPWYNALKDYLDEGNTHQLAGSFDNYALFFQTVKNDGKVVTADELHNVGEAIVGVEYGMENGIWWSFI